MADNFFEQYVNSELPTKLGTAASPAEVTAGLVAVSTGLGLQFELVDPKDIPTLAGKSAFDLAVEGGYEGTIEEWIVSLKGADGTIGVDGKSAYQIALDGGFDGEEATWLASLVGPAGEDGVTGVDGKSAYAAALEAGFVGDEAAFNQALVAAGEGVGVGGGVFIVDVLPQGAGQNTGDKVRSEDGYSVKTFSSTTNNLVVKLLAITGSTNFKPVITVNGIAATMTKQADAPMWDGTVAVEVTAEGSALNLVALHEDGARATAVGLIDTAPEMLTAVFTGTYPGVQTELKAGDTMSIAFTVNEDVTGYEIADTGAFVAKTGTLTAGKTHTLNGLVIANRGTTSTAQGIRMRVSKASGAWSEWFESTTAGVVDLVNTVKLNNIKPIITVNSVVYPAAQAAIKAGQSVTVKHVIQNADTYTYTSVNSTVNIPLPELYATDKVVEYLAGSYNDLTQNLTIGARKLSNGATASTGVIIKISNVLPVVTMSVPAARLRSGGNAGTVAQKHVVTLTSDQSLVSVPEVNAPEGTWDVEPWVPNGTRKVWTRSLVVHDDDIKGTYDFNSLVAVNGAGTAQNVISSGTSYILGGFVFRTISVAAYPNREAAIGTAVVNTSKLRCSNLSKGAGGSLNFTYQATDADAPNKYTIKGTNSWYNCDAPNSTSNTSGLMSVELEEVV